MDSVEATVTSTMALKVDRAVVTLAMVLRDWQSRGTLLPMRVLPHRTGKPVEMPDGLSTQGGDQATGINELTVQFHGEGKSNFVSD